MASNRILTLRSVGTQFCGAPRTRVPRAARFNSSYTSPNHLQPLKGHIVSGLIGGGVVLIGGCLWYQFSGVKAAVEASKALTNTLPPPNEAIDYLRKMAKSYTVFVPRASKVIDPVFDRLEEIHTAHRRDVDAVIAGTYNDIKSIVNGKKSTESNSGSAILGVLQRRAAELGQVAANFTKPSSGR